MLSNKRRIENQIDLILLILGELKGMRRGGSSVDNMNRRSEEAYIMKILSLSHTGGKENSAYRRSIKAIQIYPGGSSGPYVMYTGKIREHFKIHYFFSYFFALIGKLTNYGHPYGPLGTASYTRCLSFFFFALIG